jgi:AraC-like DNA-binding protein
MSTTLFCLPDAKVETKTFNEPLTPVPMHSHEEFQFSCCEAGAGRYRFSRCSYAVPRRTLVAVQAGEMHGFDPLLHPPIGSLYRALYISPSAIRELPIAGRVRFTLALREPIVHYRQLRHAFLAAHRTFLESDMELEKQTVIDSFLLLIAQRHSRESIPLVQVGREKIWVRKVRQYLDANASRNISVQELVNLTGLNRMYLTRVFTEEVGMPPHAYLLGVRLHQAQALLRKGEAITDVALATGFSDQAHFSRHFRKYFGLTPGRSFTQNGHVSGEPAANGRKDSSK